MARLDNQDVEAELRGPQRADEPTAGAGEVRSAGHVLVLTSGAHRVDTTMLAARLGVERLKRADADFVREHTGQAIGGVAPLGHPSPVPTYIDRWLQRHPVVWAATD